MSSDVALLREILDAQLEMVCRYRADGTILFANRAYANSLKREPADLAGQSLWQFVTGSDQAHVREMLDKLTPDEPELTIENRFETAGGTRWMLWRNHALEFDQHGRWSVAQSTAIDITERRQLEEQLELLVGELNHRVKNTLMVVQAMAYQTFRGPDVPVVPVQKFNQRLAALSGAHDTLSRENWTGASLAEIVRQGLLICGDGSGRIMIGGPHVMFPANATVSLVMVLHELATNAMKYGALSGDTGTVAVHWSIEAGNDWAIIQWQEQGGPPVVPPTRKGFGSRLVTDAVPRQLGGRIDLEYRETGLRCRIAIPLSGTAQ
jgi:PAS domain S-box-containing protein